MDDNHSALQILTLNQVFLSVIKERVTKKELTFVVAISLYFILSNNFCFSSGDRLAILAWASILAFCNCSGDVFFIMAVAALRNSGLFFIMAADLRIILGSTPMARMRASSASVISDMDSSILVKSSSFKFLS